MKRASWQSLMEDNRRLRQENRALKIRVADLEAQVTQRESQVAQLEAKVAQLTAQLQASQREAKRQAAPFSQGPPKAHPKKPGRKPGSQYGVKARRQPPPPEAIDEFYDVPLPGACPHCGGRVSETHTADQYQTEIPCRVIHRQFHIHIGCCEECGRRVQGRHDLQTSEALGAAASQLGPNLQAAIAFLNKRCGLSHGKIVQFFGELFDLRLSRGGSVQATMRAGRRCRAVYNEIVKSVRGSPWAVPDETGWKIGGRPAWLHAIVGDQATCYVITRSRSAKASAHILGEDYAGTLVHDGYRSYDRFGQAWHQQCVRHVMRRAQKMLESARGRAREFPEQVLALFRRALEVRDRRDQGELSEDEVLAWYFGLEGALEALTACRKRHPANERLRKHLQRHRWQWFAFLLDEAIDATNYRAEQAIRGAVVNRKVWGGNRTGPGTRVQEVLMSVFETCHRQHQNAITFLSRLLRGTPPPLLATTPTTGP